MLLATPMLAVMPSSDLIRLLISRAMVMGEPYSPTLPVTSNQFSSRPNGSTWSV